MSFVIRMTSDEGVVSFFDGATFVDLLTEARVISGIEEARYLQGVYQSQFSKSEVAKVVVTATIALS